MSVVTNRIATASIGEMKNGCHPEPIEGWAVG